MAFVVRRRHDVSDSVYLLHFQININDCVLHNARIFTMYGSIFKPPNNSGAFIEVEYRGPTGLNSDSGQCEFNPADLDSIDKTIQYKI